MNIVKVAGHACVRLTKEAVALMWKGHKIHVISKKEPLGASQFSTWTRCTDVGQFVDAIKVFSKTADMFHVHNEPSWYVTAIKENCDVPVVLDVHDSWLARSTPEEADSQMCKGINHVRITSEERNNFQLADGLIFPSKPFADLVRNEFKLNQPYAIVPSYLPSQFYAYESKEWLGGLVYEGRVDLKTENDKSKQCGFGFRYTEYEDLAQKAFDLGIDFHLYARNDKPFLDVYEKIAFTHVPQPYEALMGCLSSHDWGLVGNFHKSSEWDIALPNKLFEYIAASVPVVAMNAKHCSEFLEEHGVGITVNSLEELRDRWGEHREIRKNLIKKRKDFTMDNHIYQVENLYKAIDRSICKIPNIGIQSAIR